MERMRRRSVDLYAASVSREQNAFLDDAKLAWRVPTQETDQPHVIRALNGPNRIVLRVVSTFMAVDK